LCHNQGISLLSSLLASEWSGFFSYFLRFIMIAVWWNAHQRYFEYVTGYDGRLKALNLSILLTITLMPFFTKLLDMWSTDPFAIALYALDQGAAGTLISLT
jgi:uncharacterized membrane protein